MTPSLQSLVDHLHKVNINFTNLSLQVQSSIFLLPVSTTNKSQIFIISNFTLLPLLPSHLRTYFPSQGSVRKICIEITILFQQQMDPGRIHQILDKCRTENIRIQVDWRNEKIKLNTNNFRNNLTLTSMNLTMSLQYPTSGEDIYDHVF